MSPSKFQATPNGILSSQKVDEIYKEKLNNLLGRKTMIQKFKALKKLEYEQSPKTNSKLYYPPSLGNYI